MYKLVGTPAIHFSFYTRKWLGVVYGFLLLPFLWGYLLDVFVLIETGV